MLAIIGGIAGTTIGMLRAQRARSEAEAVSGFLTDLIDSANPWQRKNETTVRELLEEAANRIDHQLKDQPSARAELLQAIGTSEFHLGHLDRARAVRSRNDPGDARQEHRSRIGVSREPGVARETE
jgi:hypothetical protein